MSVDHHHKKSILKEEVCFGSWFRYVVSCFGDREGAEHHSKEHIDDSTGLLTSWPEEGRKGGEGREGGRRKGEGPAIL